MVLISIDISEEDYNLVKKSGFKYRSVFLAGLYKILKKDEDIIPELQKKIEKLSVKLSEAYSYIWKLEDKIKNEINKKTN